MGYFRKMNLLIASILATSVAAFAPTKIADTSALTLNAANFEGELGVQAPLGLFDPLGLLDTADQEKFDRLRYTEVKHGRICMLAFLGNIITRAGLHLPGSIDKAGDSFASFPNGIAALIGPDAIPGKGFLQIVLFVGILEVFVMKDITGTGEFP